MLRAPRHCTEANRLHRRNFRRRSQKWGSVEPSRGSHDWAEADPITQAWNASCTQSGAAVSCVNASRNGSVPDGGSVTFGFNGSWSGSNPVPVVTLG
ncbi:cellulose binding domain-containing protein [Streptomyces coeruleorubidus]|uniref:cellulose binding domain-containing protein n=1 Tax=Streptomyces coeruleorubidus TaxID=116188 RepID=UPI0033BF1D1F